MDSRRDFLKKAMMLSGVAGFSCFVPNAVQRAFAIDPEVNSSYLDAEHVVILMQENRSFDHELGTLQGVRGFNDPRAVRLANGNSVFLQTSSKTGKTYAPWRLNIKDTRATWLGSIPHTRSSQVDAWNGGNYNNWIDAKRPYHAEYERIPLTMGYYTREDLPFYYALADAFTVCDQNYCGVMSSTTPNRALFWTGTVRDRQSPDSLVFLNNSRISAGDMTWKTYPERLEDAGISWKFYQNDLAHSGGLTSEQRRWLGNFGLNDLENFRAYHVEFTPRYAALMREWIRTSLREIKRLNGELKKTDTGSENAKLLRDELKLRSMELAQSRDHLRRSRGGLAQLSARDRDLNRRAFVTNEADPDFHTLETLNFLNGRTNEKMQVPKGDVFFQFRKDVQTGKLPTISWLAAPENFSDHPSAPWYGAWYVSEVMDILTENPEVWKKTIFILTYDENDGYIDHCPSFVAPDPKNKDSGGASEGIGYTGLEYAYVKDALRQGIPRSEARSGPIGLGFRVPMIIASPWSRGGWVNSQVFDHSSTIQFLEQFVGQKFKKQTTETNISPWRRAVCGDLTSVFRPYDGRKPKLPFLNRNEYVESIQRARYKEIPSDYKALSTEEIVGINHDPRASKMIAVQEPGIRQACAIPYELYTDGNLDPSESSFDISMVAAKKYFGESSMGAPFNVYLYGTNRSSATTALNLSHPNMMAATYAVKAGDTMKESIPLSRFTSGQYDIAVHGPNGFYRAFTGGSDDPSIEVRCQYQPSKTGSKLLVHIIHRGAGRAVEVQVLDHYNRHRSIKSLSPGDPRAIIAVDLSTQHDWYDISLSVDGVQGFLKRYAGHIETGQPSRTDPIMGSAVDKA